jgi:hypothetical protein
MNFLDIVYNINFRYVNPHQHSKSSPKIAKYIEKAGLNLELSNTILPQNNFKNIKKFFRLCKIPKMSTYLIGVLLNYAVREMKAEHSFLNVGVWNGFTFLSGLIDNSDKKCIGVDNFSEFGGPKDSFLEKFSSYKCSEEHIFFEMDYKDYLQTKHKDKLGVYLYDGEHSYENQYEGLKQAEPFFGDDCIIFVDDTNYPDPRNATYDFISKSENMYQILMDRTTCISSHPTFWNGLIIFKKLDLKNNLKDSLK